MKVYEWTLWRRIYLFYFLWKPACIFAKLLNFINFKLNFFFIWRINKQALNALVLDFYCQRGNFHDRFFELDFECFGFEVDIFKFLSERRVFFGLDLCSWNSAFENVLVKIFTSVNELLTNGLFPAHIHPVLVSFIFGWWFKQVKHLD